MPDTTQSFIESFWAWFAGSGIGMTFLGWFGITTYRRIGKLEKVKADKDDVDEEMKLVHSSLEAISKRVDAGDAATHKRLDRILEIVAKK